MARSMLVLLAACAQLLSGCSIVFTRRAALPAEPSPPVRCTESRAAPIADTVVTAALFAAAAALIADGVRTEEQPGQVDCTSCFSFALSILPLAYGGFTGVSAMVGYARMDRCRRVHAWQAQCLAGDRDACAALHADPGAEPSAPERPR